MALPNNRFIKMAGVIVMAGLCVVLNAPPSAAQYALNGGTGREVQREPMGLGNSSTTTQGSLGHLMHPNRYNQGGSMSLYERQLQDQAQKEAAQRAQAKADRDKAAAQRAAAQRQAKAAAAQQRAAAAAARKAEALRESGLNWRIPQLVHLQRVLMGKLRDTNMAAAERRKLTKIFNERQVILRQYIVKRAEYTDTVLSRTAKDVYADALTRMFPWLTMPSLPVVPPKA